MCDIQIKTITYGAISVVYKAVLSFKTVDETLVCDHSNKSYWAVLLSGTVCYAVWGTGTCHWKCLMSLHFGKFKHFSQLWSFVLSTNHFYFCISHDSNFIFTWEKLLKGYMSLK